jgi:hypothetical protein
MADGAGRVVVIVHITGTRQGGRSLDDQQILLATIEGDRVQSIDQFIGDPAAVTAFWA